jgi:hypothetical protein
VNACGTGKTEMLIPLSEMTVETGSMPSHYGRMKGQSTPQGNELVDTCSVVLPKAGIGRAILVTVQVPITIGTAAGVPSPKAPHNLFTNIHLQDYSGIDRVNSSCYMLGQLHMLKKRMWEPSSSYPYVDVGNTMSAVNTQVTAATDPYASGAQSQPFGLTAPYTHTSGQGGAGEPSANGFFSFSRWSIPTATSSANYTFSFWIPIAFDLNDPQYRGPYMATCIANDANSVNGEIPNTERSLTMLAA